MKNSCQETIEELAKNNDLLTFKPLQMKTIINLLLLLFVTNSVFSQEYAEFSADASIFEKNGQLPDTFKKHLWIINGQELRYGSKPIKVKVNPNKIDTILYRGNAGYKENQFDTILCHISKAKKYKFVYNPCCFGFNIIDMSNVSKPKKTSAEVIFQLTQPNYNQTYLGTLGETGILLKYPNTYVFPANWSCRSAMSSNIFRVSLRQIASCTYKCNEIICLQENDEIKYDYEFRTISKKIEVLFAPLDTEALLIFYNPKNGRIIVK